MENKIVENLEQLKKMLVLLSEERKVVLSHHKTFEHVEKMRAIVDESIVQFGTTSPKNSTPIQEKIGTDTEEKTNIDTVDNASRPALTLRPVRLKYFQSL